MIGFCEAIRDNTNLGIGGRKKNKFQRHEEHVFLPINIPALASQTHPSESPPPSRRIVPGASASVAPSYPWAWVFRAFPPKGLTAYSYSPRCQSRIARTLPVDQKPECRPYWEKDDPSMPLPFDLTDTVAELRGLLLEAKP